MQDSYETLKVERIEEYLLQVTFNRPDSANALNTQMGRDMRDLWGGFYVDQEDIRCIVVTGAGDRFFCAGGDLKERNNMTDEQWQQQHALFEQSVVMMMARSL